MFHKKKHRYFKKLILLTDMRSAGLHLAQLKQILIGLIFFTNIVSLKTGLIGLYLDHLKYINKFNCLSSFQRWNKEILVQNKYFKIPRH